MDTCIRGFSFMPESKLDVDLQYIEDGELDRAWKVNRRQRLKQQEQRIWEEFVKEQDIVHMAYTEDPYQFLHELPENCLKELMEKELNKMKKEADEAESVVEPSNQGEGDHPNEKQAVHVVTFAEDMEKPDLVAFQIFDDETDLNPSGEEEQLESPSTVRERCSEEPAPAPALDTSNHCATDVAVKSTENVSNVIESSIYCARVKDMRIKIGEEMVAIMASLEVQDVMSAERGEVSRRCRRAAEFCARFNRIYMYQLHRQVQNIKRHVSQSLPLAQHTYFQSQMLRVVSLHQNMLQALQVFHKSFSATSCLRDCARALSGICTFVRDASATCRTVLAPRDLAAMHNLYSDELLETCDKLDSAITEYTHRVADFLSSSDIATTEELNATPSSTRTKKSKKSLTFTKSGSKTWSTKDTDARLSMYSLDTLRINLHSKSSTSRDNHSSGTSKGHASSSTLAPKQQSEKQSDKPAKRIIRRPLMRAPQSGAARPRPRRQDLDIATMVEAVDTCESSHAVSQSPSPRSCDRTPRRNTPRRNTPRRNTPRPHVSRSPQLTSRSFQKISPRTKHCNISPKVRSRRSSPKALSSKKSPTITETTTTITSAKTPFAPVTKIQCAKKQQNTEKSPGAHDKSLDRSKNNEEGPDQSRKSTNRSRNIGKSTDRSGKSTDRSRNFDKSSERSGLNTNRSRNEKNSGRGKEVDRCNGSKAKSSVKGKENVNRKSDRVGKNGSLIDINKEKDGREEKDLVCDDENPDIDAIHGKGDKDVIYDKVDRPGHIGNPGKEDNTGREFCGVKELTDNGDDYSRSYAKEVDEERIERDKNKVRGHMSPVRCDVTRLLRQLCSGDPVGLPNERITGAKNAQLLCVRAGSPPRQPSTPQLLRILEETIQKQTPRPVYVKPQDPERFRLAFNLPEKTANGLFQYRTKFVQHMLTSPLYANSAVGKPWEMIGSISDKIIDELLTNIAKEMEIKPVLLELYNCETN